MKKLVVPIILLAIGFILGWYFCKIKCPTTALTETKGITSYHSENSISFDEAKMLVDTFGMYGLQDADHHPGGKGIKTRSVFIPLTKLDSLVAALDAARAKDGKTDGIRFYFGRYPKMELDGKTRYEHPFRNTLILISTRDTTIKQKGSLQPVKIHMDYYGLIGHKATVGMFFIPPQNRGEICPDNCDGATLVCPDPTDPTCGN